MSEADRRQVQEALGRLDYYQGGVDGIFGRLTRDAIRRFQQDIGEEGYLLLNTQAPPFDDIHVRKAANLVMNKSGILRAWGGTTFGQIATHAIPPAVLNNTLGQDFNPYASPDFGGDEAKAKEEMKQSKYDSNKDGVCDASACKDIVMINRNRPPWSNAEPVVVDSFANSSRLTADSVSLTSRDADVPGEGPGPGALTVGIGRLDGSGLLRTAAAAVAAGRRPSPCARSRCTACRPPRPTRC